MESKITILEISVWGGVYHLNNRPNLPKEPRTSLDIFKMAAELVLLSEALDASIDEELLLDHEEGEEFQVIATTSAFMKRELKRNVGFCEVVVPYSIEEFKSHFRMTKTTFEVLARELVATVAIPRGNRFGRKRSSSSSSHVDASHVTEIKKLAYGLELVSNGKW